MRQAFFEVVPAETGWVVRMPGDSVSEMRATKGDAIRRARELGRQYDAWHIRVLSKSGELEADLSSKQPTV